MTSDALTLRVNFVFHVNFVYTIYLEHLVGTIICIFLIEEYLNTSIVCNSTDVNG